MRIDDLVKAHAYLESIKPPALHADAILLSHDHWDELLKIAPSDSIVLLPGQGL